MRARRTIEDYETEGRRFYRLAEEHPAARLMDLTDVFALLRENFTSARKPLAFIASRYLHSKRHHLFGPPKSLSAAAWYTNRQAPPPFKKTAAAIEQPAHNR